jgi:hypothetical protein
MARGTRRPASRPCIPRRQPCIANEGRISGPLKKMAENWYELHHPRRWHARARAHDVLCGDDRSSGGCNRLRCQGRRPGQLALVAAGGKHEQQRASQESSKRPAISIHVSPLTGSSCLPERLDGMHRIARRIACLPPGARSLCGQDLTRQQAKGVPAACICMGAGNPLRDVCSWRAACCEGR